MNPPRPVTFSRTHVTRSNRCGDLNNENNNNIPRETLERERDTTNSLFRGYEITYFRWL